MQNEKILNFGANFEKYTPDNINMALLRFNALKEVFNREPLAIETPSSNVSKYFGVNVLS